MGVHLALLLLVAAGEGNATGPGDGGARSAAGYVFAVVPQAPPVVMSVLWTPIVERVARESGVPLRIKLYEQVEAFQADLAAGAVDLAYLNPVQAIRAFQSARYRPLIRDERPVHGVFFVERESRVATMAELAGREVAFAGPWSFCSVSLRQQTESLGIVPRYVTTTANVYKHVLLGLVSGGGALDYALDDATREDRERLRVIYSTPPMAPHPVVVHPRVPAPVAAGIAEAFRALARTGEGEALLRRVHLERPILAEYARDYAPLSQLLDAPPAPVQGAGRR
jgi:phosphonate transport system substrate-binding protein